VRSSTQRSPHRRCRRGMHREPAAPSRCRRPRPGLYDVAVMPVSAAKEVRRLTEPARLTAEAAAAPPVSTQSSDGGTARGRALAPSGVSGKHESIVPRTSTLQHPSSEPGPASVASHPGHVAAGNIIHAAVEIAATPVLAEEGVECAGQVAAVVHHGRDSTTGPTVCQRLETDTSPQ
jgi:hypothetical protein